MRVGLGTIMETERSATCPVARAQMDVALGASAAHAQPQLQPQPQPGQEALAHACLRAMFQVVTDHSQHADADGNVEATRAARTETREAMAAVCILPRPL